MRREARALSRRDMDMSAFEEARRLSGMPVEIDAALRNENVSKEALRIQRLKSMSRKRT